MKLFGVIIIALLFSFSSLASVAPITGTASICLGSHRTLSDATVAGSWSSNTPTVATVNVTGVVTAVSVGTSVISYIAGSGYATQIVTVNPLPDVFTVTGGGTCCANGSGVSIGLSGSEADIIYSLYITTSSGTSLVGSGGYLGTGASLDLGHHATAGTYLVVAHNLSTNCISNMTGTVAVTVNPLPSLIVGEPTVCEGGTVTFSDPTPGGSWSSYNTALATVGTIDGMVSGISAGLTMITFKLPTGCYRTKPVNVISMPLPVITYDAPSNTLYATTSFDHYQWYDSLEGLIPGAIAPSLAIIANEYYFVKVADNNGCYRSSALFHFNEDLLGAATAAPVHKLIVFPNPAQTELYLVYRGKISGVIILDASGQQVFANDYNSETVTINVAFLPPGIYQIRLNGSMTSSFKKY